MFGLRLVQRTVWRITDRSDSRCCAECALCLSASVGSSLLWKMNPSTFIMTLITGWERWPWRARSIWSGIGKFGCLRLVSHRLIRRRQRLLSGNRPSRERYNKVRHRGREALVLNGPPLSSRSTFVKECEENGRA